jgi:hypothetical protein
VTCLGFVVIALTMASSSAAPPEVVAGDTSQGCASAATWDRGERRLAKDARFNGASPLLTLAVNQSGTVFVGDTSYVRRLSNGWVETVVGKPGEASTGPPQPFPQGSAPTRVNVVVNGMAVSGERLYVATNWTGDSDLRIISVDLAAPRPQVNLVGDPFPAVGPGPKGMAVDASGTVFLTQPPSPGGQPPSPAGRLGRIRPDQSSPQWWDLPTEAQSVAVDASGTHAYVAGAADHVLDVDVSKSPPTVTPIGPQLSSQPEKRVALDRENEALFVSDPDSGAIHRIDLETPHTSQRMTGAGGTLSETQVRGLGVASVSGQQRLFVLDGVRCTVLSAEATVAGGPTSVVPANFPTTVPPDQGQNNNLTNPPGNSAEQLDPSATGANAGEGSPAGSGDSSGAVGPNQGESDPVTGGLDDSGGGRLTGDDLVDQILAGRTDGAFSGSESIPDFDFGLLTAPGARGDAVFGGDLAAIAAPEGAAGAAPPGPPPAVTASPGAMGSVGPVAGGPGAVAGAPPPVHGQLNPTPGWGGASSDPAEGAPRYAMVSNDGDGLGAGAVLVSLLALGGCSLLFALHTARGGAGGPGSAGSPGRPAPARAWAR